MRAMLRSAVAIVVVLVGITGCGGHAASHAGEQVHLIRPIRPVWCPTRHLTSGIEQSQPNARTAGSFDTRELLGEPEKTAASRAGHSGCSLRVISRDRHRYILTADARLNRVDVDIDRGLMATVGVN